MFNLNNAGCSSAQTIDQTITFSQTFDNTSYQTTLGIWQFNLAYYELRQTDPQVVATLGFTVAVKTRTTTSVTFTFTQTAKNCIGNLGVYVVMESNPYVEVGISAQIDTSSTGKIGKLIKLWDSLVHKTARQTLRLVLTFSRPRPEARSM